VTSHAQQRRRRGRHRPVSPLARAAAAVLACGSGAALSHWSAAVLWGIRERWPAIVDVTAPTSRRQRGIRLHRSRSLTADDSTIHYGITVTTPARTLLDLADHLSDARLARAVNDARLHRLVTLSDLAAQLDRSPGRATSRLRPFLERPTGPTRSGMEDAFLAFVHRFNLPAPEVNQVVEGHTVDMLRRDRRLIAELDSRAFHDDDQPFEVDRERDAELLAAGWRVIRITWRRLTEQPEREALRLARLLS
jgi:hypothetical protein